MPVGVRYGLSLMLLDFLVIDEGVLLAGYLAIYVSEGSGTPFPVEAECHNARRYGVAVPRPALSGPPVTSTQLRRRRQIHRPVLRRLLSSARRVLCGPGEDVYHEARHSNGHNDGNSSLLPL